MDVRLRTMTIEDYDAVYRLWQRCEGIVLGLSDTRAAIARFLNRNPDLSFVALMDDRIVGAVMCGHEGRRGYIHHLAVDPPHRHHGIGRALVDACLQRLRDLNIEKCHIFVMNDNEEGFAFWKHTDWMERTELKVMTRVLIK
ncbi:MAG: GNAT family N-acetyltransferase [candidate division KSB1 bacterium]|nr:GNAT family N-acetyltransferase [candidate division KSB1 bacterium]